VSSFWDEFRRDQDRRQREQRRNEEWLRKEADADRRRAGRGEEALSRAERAEAARREREEGLADAQQGNAGLAATLAAQAGVLAAVVASPPPSLEKLRSGLEETVFVPDGVAEDPRPVWQDFAPDEPRFLGRRRYEREVAEARGQFNLAMDDHRFRHAAKVDAAQRAHDDVVAAALREHDRQWDSMADGLRRRDPEAVSEFVGAALASVTPLAQLIGGGRAVYLPDAREVVLELELPDTDAIPAERGWRYVAARKALDPQPRTVKDAHKLYSDLISRIVLASMLACFRATEGDLVDLVTANGHVRTIDPATGRPDFPCLVTVTAGRETFDSLVLDSDRLNPAACLAALGAELSPHPYEMEGVRPFVDVDHAQYRLITAAEALVDVDHREDLLKMDPYDFERLIKQLFTAMGYKTWRTRSWGDDGIDAVATKEDDVFPFECVIQAKRFHKAVPPRDVQSLMGAMIEHSTATHGVLVTTSWLSDRSRQRARAQRIMTFEGSNLIYLIEKHLNRKVVISTRPPNRRT
jgi:restriction system protein